jgi:hypothetical protein
MAEVVRTLDSAIDKLNSLYNGSSTPPTSGEEDYAVWTDLLNIAINIWEFEDGQKWRELFIELADAGTGTGSGDKTTDGTNSYELPTNFREPNSAYVWLGTGTNKIPYKVIDIADKQLYENNTDRWCYFTTTTLEFNPNLAMSTGDTISYNYYKHATALTTGTDEFEMSDPMFAVYYALAELKKEEGDVTALTIATQKRKFMQTLNMAHADNQDSDLINPIGDGFGV